MGPALYPPPPGFTLKQSIGKRQYEHQAAVLDLQAGEEAAGVPGLCCTCHNSAYSDPEGKRPLYLQLGPRVDLGQCLLSAYRSCFPQASRR